MNFEKISGKVPFMNLKYEKWEIEFFSVTDGLQTNRKKRQKQSLHRKLGFTFCLKCLL